MPFPLSMIESEQCTACRLVFWLTHTYLLVTVSDLFNAVPALFSWVISGFVSGEVWNVENSCIHAQQTWSCFFVFFDCWGWGMKTRCVLSYLYEHRCFFTFSYMKNSAFCDGYWQKLEDFQTEKYSGKNDFRMSDWNAAREERGEPALVFPLIEFPTLSAFLQDCFSRV